MESCPLYQLDRQHRVAPKFVGVAHLHGPCLWLTSTSLMAFQLQPKGTDLSCKAGILQSGHLAALPAVANSKHNLPFVVLDLHMLSVALTLKAECPIS